MSAYDAAILGTYLIGVGIGVLISWIWNRNFKQP